MLMHAEKINLIVIQWLGGLWIIEGLIEVLRLFSDIYELEDDE
jgi:hypothetical protein